MKHSKAPAVPSTIPQGAEILRRGVLALVTALIVARPLVLGEDPGLLARESEPSGLVLALLWFVTGLAWAVWRGWSGTGTWYGSLVEVGLLGVVFLMFASAAGPASYKHPAWLIAWEWLALLIAFCLVRQLVVTPLEQQGLLAVILATGVSLSAYGVHQYFVRMPELRAMYLAPPEEPTEVTKNPQAVATFGIAPAIAPNMPFPAGVPLLALSMSSQKPPLTPLQKHLAQRGIYLEADDPEMENWSRRIGMDHVYSRFAHPNSFAGYLVVLLPAAAGCAWASWRNQRAAWQTILTAGCVVLMAFTLWLTHSRGAILGLLLASGAAAFYWRRFLLAHRGWVAAGAVGLLVLAAGGYLLLKSSAFGKGTGTVQVRLDYWAATWKMIGEHGWLGVGPGNFSRFYPRYMRPTAFEHITDPHNFVLEIWATAGFLALAALLVALGVFFWRVGRAAWRAGDVSPLLGSHKQGADAPRSPEARVYWEFYLGGMIGQILALMVWAPGKSGDEILVEGFTSAGLSIFWFGSFALFEKISWTGPARALTLATGVLALLFNLCVSGGISFPSVALFLWVMVALALNVLPATPIAWIERQWLTRVLPVPVLAAIAVVYFANVFRPVTDGAYWMRVAQRNALHLQPAVADGAEEGRKRERPDVIVAGYVLPAVKKAWEADPGKAEYHLQGAYWYGEAWKMHPLKVDSMDQARSHAELVHGPAKPREGVKPLDPESKDGYLASAQLRTMYADWFGRQQGNEEEKGVLAKERQYLLETAANLVQQAVQRDPTEARLRYQLVEALLLAETSAEQLREQALRTAQFVEKKAAEANPKDPKTALARRYALEEAKKWKDIAALAVQEREQASREARRQARMAQELDAKATTRTRQLTDRQREQVRKWLEASPAS